MKNNKLGFEILWLIFGLFLLVVLFSNIFVVSSDLKPALIIATSVCGIADLIILVYILIKAKDNE